MLALPMTLPSVRFVALTLGNPSVAHKSRMAQLLGQSRLTRQLRWGVGTAGYGRARSSSCRLFPMGVEPLLVPWRGTEVRVRHDDPLLGPHTQRAAVIGSAIQLAGSVDGLRRVLEVFVGEWYTVADREVPLPLTVALRRRTKVG